MLNIAFKPFIVHVHFNKSFQKAVSLYLFCYKIFQLVIQAVKILTIILILQLQKIQPQGDKILLKLEH